MAIASEEMKRAFEKADMELRRKEESQENAAVAHGFDRQSIEARDAAILLVAKLRSEGVRIRNDAFNVTDNELGAWLVRVHDWMGEVIEGIEYINAADAEYFSTLDVVPPARVNFTVLVSPERIRPLVKAYNEHDLRLVRLDELLRKYRYTNGVYAPI